jgi:DNA-binding transcriptional ArsR family regulator
MATAAGLPGILREVKNLCRIDGQYILSVMNSETRTPNSTARGRDPKDSGRDPETPGRDVAIISDPDKAAVLLKDPRLHILAMAATPMSAVEMADRLGETRQRIGYHLRQLVEAGLLEDVVVSRRGAMVEKRYQASAASYALSPSLLGSLTARMGSSSDQESARHLLGAIHEVQNDLAQLLAEDGSASDRMPTLTLSTRIRFRDAKQRAAFADALMAGLTNVVAQHTAPFEETDGTPGEGEPFRLTLTLNPTPS